MRRPVWVILAGLIVLTALGIGAVLWAYHLASTNSAEWAIFQTAGWSVVMFTPTLLIFYYLYDRFATDDAMRQAEERLLAPVLAVWLVVALLSAVELWIPGSELAQLEAVIVVGMVIIAACLFAVYDQRRRLRSSIRAIQRDEIESRRRLWPDEK